MPKIKVVGMTKLKKKFKYGVTMNDVKRVVANNGEELQSKAQEKAPVGTPESTGIPEYIGGTLQRSIGVELRDGGMTAEVEPTAHYGAYVELGTRFMDARPYLKPAYDEQKKKFKKDMDKLVR